MNTAQSVDIVLVGSGLAGLCFAATILKESNLSIAIIEKNAFISQNQGAHDPRTIAISASSVEIMQSLDIWQAIKDQANPVKQIHVSHKGRFGSSVLEPSSLSENLGYISSYNAITHAFLGYLSSQERCHIIDNATLASATPTETGWSLAANTVAGAQTLHSQLLIASDGSFSQLRKQWRFSTQEFDYGLDALVCSIQCSKHNQHQAFERFMDTGLAAMLPRDDYSFGLVWALPRDSDLFSASETELNKALQKNLGWRCGKLSLSSKVARFPLMRTLANDWTMNNAFLLGNSQHSLHPVAGQGFNLSARDASSLAKLCIKHQLDYQSIYSDFERFRQSDIERTLLLSHALPRLFNFKNPLISHARQLGLLAFDSLPQIGKSWFVQQASGQLSTPISS